MEEYIAIDNRDGKILCSDDNPTRCRFQAEQIVGEDEYTLYRKIGN